ncbi:hypothetical protein D2V17_11885 [Aurantiacibacter xanthus]|uniref:Uncharacterized protein n=1 Tax=Aurantiacibacter xanthus TaxID=1784712 RepID=A0A3A1P7P8_9SPHN|nr:hypothetical protein [Aurantiacibacter xanthus]RIV84390.1 hypothetical protein D2V17_11885 [Aurantiacibacter xanthus]
MPITIQPADEARLQLSGDAETVMILASRAIREGFAVAVSDGTLLRGHYDLKLRECSFVLAVEGSGSTSIVRGSHGDTVRLSAQIEWISVSVGRDALSPSGPSDEFSETQLELAIGERIAA